MTKRSVKLLAAFGVLVVLGGGAAYWRMQVLRRPDVAILVAAGRLRDAQLVLRDGLAKEPNAPDLHLRMGELQLKLADPVAAEKEFRRAAALGAAAEAVLPGLAQALLLQRRFAEVLRLVPGTGGAPAIAARNLLLRAEAQLAQGDTQAAERSLAAARTVAPDAADTALIAAKIAAATPGAPDTEALADAVLKRDPGKLDALLLKVRLAGQRGDAAASREAVEHALAMAPWSIEARLDRAYAAMLAGEEQKARADVGILLRDQPTLVDAVYLNAVLLFRAGNHAEAATQLARLDASATRFPQVLYYQARIAQAQKQTETAAELARRYAALVPADPDGLRLRAETELALGHATEALPAIRAAVQARPEDLAMAVLYGRLLASSRDGAEASRVLLGVADRAPPAVLEGELGIALLQTGNAARALPLLRMAAGRQPDETGLWEALALAAVAEQDAATAGSALDRLRARPDTAAAAGNIAGLIRLRAGDAAGAREEWTATLARAPGATAARFNLARLLAGQGATADALGQLRRLLTQDPADARALQLLIELSDGKPATLLPWFQAAHGAQPRNTLFTALLGNALIADDRPLEAAALVRKAAAGADTPGLLLPVLGRAQEAAGQAEDAIATFKAALVAFPADGLTRTALLRLVRERQGDAAAVALLESGIRDDPRDEVQMVALASLVRRTRGLDAAVALADRLAREPATRAAAAGLLGAVLMEAGRPAEAAAATTAEFEAGPSLPALLRMAAARGTAGDIDGAAGALRAWVAGHPDAVDAWAMLAKLDMQAGRNAAALASSAAVLRLRPGDAEALNNTAWLYFLTGDGRARSVARDAYLQVPSADSADTLGWILLSEKDASGALGLLRQASRLRPDDPTIRFHLATALSANGRDDEAVTLLEPLVSGSAAPFGEQGDARALLARLRP